MMPATITPHLLRLQAPAALNALQGWLIWRFEHSPGQAKPRKIPYYTNGGKRYGVQGRAEDREQLTSLEAAKSAAARKGFDGVGLAMLPEWGVSALDFDGCVQDGRVDSAVLDLVAGTYCEFSPSGKGVRAFVLGNLGNHKSLDLQQFGFETFFSKGFVTFTGNVLPVCEQFDTLDHVGPITAPISALCAARFGPVRVDEVQDCAPMGVRPELIDEALDALDADMSYGDWLRVGMALHHETAGEGLAVWDAWSARSAKYPGDTVVAGHWDSFGRHKGATVTIRSLVHMANQAGAHINLSTDIDLGVFEALSALDNRTSTERVSGLATTNPAPDKPPRYQFQAVDAFASLPDPGYWIKGVLPQAPLSVLFGESGAGKSFAVLDMVMAVARGVSWRGLRTRQAKVAYIAAEGAGGLRKRVRAYSDFHGVDTSQLALSVLSESPNFLLAQDVRDVILAIQASGGAQLVVIDTFAQVMPGGNENSGEDVGRALDHCKQITKHTGASVVLVHHSGKDSTKGARGWSGLRAACDAELEVTRDGDNRTIRLSKAKDDIDGTAWGFTLNQVSVGIDSDGDPVTSCVVQETAVVVPKSNKRQGEVQRLVMRVLGELQDLTGEGVHYDDLVAAVVVQLPTPERDQRQLRVKRAIQSLEDEQQISIESMRVRYV
jgi:hypothetical protein